ncbi:MAG: segregation and condensation protein [Miltoncostaeaceae bacterium]|jgi:segregation and condensation protein A|nr:segregation and condensation protein [Miltoncostaeaceae bacterium]
MSVEPLRQPLSLDVFEGSLDLLVTLLLREEVDLFELALAELVGAALGESALDRFDAATASELVVLLAALAELKSRRLLGEAEDEEPDPDAVEARERLAERLVAGAPYRRAAAWLAERAAACAGHRYRRLALAPAAAPAPPQGEPRALAEAMDRLLRARPAPSLAHLTPRRVSLPALVLRLRSALRQGRQLSFDALVDGVDRLEEAMMLLAALEVARRGEVRLEQAVPFGDIAIIPVGAPT